MFRKIISIIKICSLKLRFGKRLKIKSIRQFIRYNTEISVGKGANLYLGGISAQTNVHLVCVHGKLNIGNQVNFNRNCIIICRQKILIDDNCSFGPNVCIYDHDHSFNIDGIIPSEFKCSDIVIDSGCWIGAGAIILRGTHIGKNSVIGAGTVVKGNIPPNSLVASTRETNIIPIR